ncbi:OmpA family protein [Luteimonas sp. R10]|uniref:OmpA family protein n=1 Tax=Luteimonas sp. R10 TaxID=3108176 RepID=UPI00308D55C2|nr:OmpA family protein [Luteimonas sp. R10]
MKKHTRVDCRAGFGLCVAGVVALALTACGTRHVSRDVTPDGRAGEVVFPDVDRIALTEGTFPNLESLRTVAPGVTKEQLYQLLGRPHFREGLYGVREWDYLFHFRTADGVVTCQYKVIFDSEYRGRSFLWAPASCAGLLVDVEPESEPGSVAEHRFDLAGDALFAFARHDMEDILPGGRERLAEVAGRLKAMRDVQVRVVGHTDRIGSESDNLRLSQRRAEAVRRFLIGRGVPSHAISAQGRGESEPVEECTDGLGRDALVTCLQPNRRVELVASGLGGSAE